MAHGTAWWLDQIGRYPLLTPAQEIELGTAVQAWLQHPDGPERCPPSIRRRGNRAREQFVRCNLRLAVSYVTKRCQRLMRSHSQDDLIQAANEGIISAVEKFDPTRGYRFSTYAYWWIRQAVNRWVDRYSRAVTIPVLHHQQLYRLQVIRRELAIKHGREPTRQELASTLGVSMTTLDQLVENSLPIGSLDYVIENGDGNTIFGEMLTDQDETESIEQYLEQVEEVEALLTKLPASQQQIVRVAYGLDGIIRSKQDAAAELGMTARQMSAQLLSIQRRLRHRPLQAEHRVQGVICDAVQLSMFT